MLYRQSRALRTRDMVQRFNDPKSNRRGSVFKLNTSRDDVEEPLKRGKDQDALDRVAAFVEEYDAIDEYKGEELAFVPTSFDKFEEGLSRRLVYKGWWTTGLTMVAFNDDLPGPSAGTTPPPV
ncbi:MAG: hypothetical protein GY925_15190 [Actinomycetia bacterium]|nr:hypothetical protein [Actinomycetes bacterium]